MTAIVVVALVILGWAIARDVGRVSARRCSAGWIRRPPELSGFLFAS